MRAFVSERWKQAEHVSCDTRWRGPKTFHRTSRSPTCLARSEGDRHEIIGSFHRHRGGILVFVGVHNASAQIGETVEFTTSFPFTAGYATMPAGSYTITPDDDSPLVLRLSGAHTSVFVETQNAEPTQIPSKTEVVFKRYGDRYVLTEIWIEGSKEGAETLSVEAEHHLAKSDSKGDQLVAA
jgi:hypothetical protein